MENKSNKKMSVSWADEEVRIGKSLSYIYKHGNLGSEIAFRNVLGAPDWGLNSWPSDMNVQFTPSLGRVQKTVSRTREVFPTGSTTLLRLQLWRTRDCAHRSRHVGFFFFFLFSFFFWRERCLPKVSWKSNPAAPGLANQVWPFKKRALCSRENAHGWLRVTGTCF